GLRGPSAVSLHDALPISRRREHAVRFDEPRLEEAEVVVEAIGERAPRDLLRAVAPPCEAGAVAARVVADRAQRRARLRAAGVERDRKSTRLNSSHRTTSY